MKSYVYYNVREIFQSAKNSLRSSGSSNSDVSRSVVSVSTISDSSVFSTPSHLKNLQGVFQEQKLLDLL